MMLQSYFIYYEVIKSLIEWNGSDYTAQLVCSSSLDYVLTKFESKSRLPIPEFSVYHCMYRKFIPIEIMTVSVTMMQQNLLKDKYLFNNWKIISY